MQELRCNSKMFGIVVDDHTVEVKCNSKFCGAVVGEIVVLHRFDLKSGEVKTSKFKEVRRK